MAEMTPHERWVARTMLLRGWREYEVADVLGLSVRRVSRVMYRRITSDDAETIARMWAEGRTIPDIAREMGVSPRSVSMWASRHRDQCPARYANRQTKEDEPCVGTQTTATVG